MKIKLNLDNLKIDNLYYGGNQDWYNSYFKRLAGCGPTTAATIIMYEEKKAYNKQEFINLMNTFWKYITPGMMGVDSVDKYKMGFDKFINATKLSYSSKILNLNNTNLGEVKNYLIDAITNDHPVAFLNLNHGSEKNIDSWHWSTIVGINTDTLDIDICDEGYIKTINIGSWYESTKGNGSFIYYF